MSVKVESKKRVSGKKRDLTELSNHSNKTNEINKLITTPQRKKQKLNQQNKSKSTWKCKQCSLQNTSDKMKCIICEIPRNYKHKTDSFDDEDDEDDNNSNSWDNQQDDDDDFDLDDYDGQQYLSLNSKDIVKRNKTTKKVQKNNSNKKQPKKTLNGLQYAQCWVCSSCHAMNRLLDTIQKYQSKCALCKNPTYRPGITPLIQSFEWDHDAQRHQNQFNFGNNNNNKPRYNDDDEKYKTGHIKSYEGDLLISGLINQNNVRKLIGIKIISPDTVRLILLFYGDFQHDAFDNYWVMTHQRENFIIDGGLTTLNRTNANKGSFRNAFGMRKVTKPGRYEWQIQVKKIRNKDWDVESIDSIIIGIIEAVGIKPNMGAGFHSYADGYGLTGDGSKVNNGKYETCGTGFYDGTIVKITLQWKDTECELAFDNVLAYTLKSDKSYKLAMAMRTPDYHLQWISFKRYTSYISFAISNKTMNKNQS